MEKIKINNIMQDLFLDYLCFFESIKTTCKAMHWGVANMNVNEKAEFHKFLDGFLAEIISYQDSVAEISQGILGNYITPLNIQAKEIEAIQDSNQLCDYILNNVKLFYEKMEKQPTKDYVGLASETETFIAEIQKFKYLLNLCL